MPPPYQLLSSDPSATATTLHPVDPDATAQAQKIVCDVCHSVLAGAGGTIAGSVITIAMQTFSGAGVLAELFRLEHQIQNSLGDAEVAFIQGIIPDDAEGFMDLLAAYEALWTENRNPRSELDRLATWRKRVTFMGTALEKNKFTILRLNSLLKRCTTTLQKTEEVLRGRRFAPPPVVLHYGYYPTGARPWHPPVKSLRVLHIWIYDKDGKGIKSKKVTGLRAQVLSGGRPDLTGTLGLVRSSTEYILLFDAAKTALKAIPRHVYNVQTTDPSGFAYLRALPVPADCTDHRHEGIEPIRAAPAVWPPAPTEAPTAPTLDRPLPAYYPEAPSHSRRSSTQQMQPQMLPRIGLAPSDIAPSSRAASGNTHIYPPTAASTSSYYVPVQPSYASSSGSQFTVSEQPGHSSGMSMGYAPAPALAPPPTHGYQHPYGVSSGAQYPYTQQPGPSSGMAARRPPTHPDYPYGS